MNLAFNTDVGVPTISNSDSILPWPKWRMRKAVTQYFFSLFSINTLSKYNNSTAVQETCPGQIYLVYSPRNRLIIVKSSFQAICAKWNMWYQRVGTYKIEIRPRLQGSIRSERHIVMVHSSLKLLKIIWCQRPACDSPNRGFSCWTSHPTVLPLR